MSRGASGMLQPRTLVLAGLILLTLSVIPVMLSRQVQITASREEKVLLPPPSISAQVLQAIQTLTSMPEESLRDLPVDQLTSLKNVVKLHLASLLMNNNNNNKSQTTRLKNSRDASMLARFAEMSRHRLLEHIQRIVSSTDPWTRMHIRDAPVPVSTGDMAALGGERSLRQMRCLIQLVSAHGACPISGQEETLGVAFASRHAPAVAIKEHLERCVDTLFRQPLFLNRSLSRVANAVDDLCDLYAVSGLNVSHVRRRKAIPLAERHSAAHQTLSTPKIGGCQVRMLDAGIPAAFFEQSTDRVGVRGGGSSPVISDNVTIGGVALRNDGSRAFERRVPWKPFDIAPLGPSWLWESTTRPSVRSELGLREALNVVERSYYVFMDVWEGDLGKQHAALHQGLQRKEWTIEERFEGHQTNKRSLAKHSPPVAAAIERLKADYVIEGAYNADGPVMLVRPRDGVNRNRILQAPVQEEPLLTLAEAVAILFSKMNKTTHHHHHPGGPTNAIDQLLPSFLWKTDARRQFLPLDLRIPLVIAAGAVPIFRDFKRRGKMFFQPSCDSCYPSLPHDAYGRVYKANGLSFATPRGSPVIDWMRFDAERYAILRSDLIKHARLHMTTRAMALNVLRRTKPEARSVVVLATNPRLAALHALVHGLCDLGNMQVWMPRSLEEGMRGDSTSRAVFGLLSASPYRRCVRFANGTSGIEVASSEAQVVVAVLDDRPVSPILNRVGVLRQNLQQVVGGGHHKRTPSADTAIVYTGGYSNHLGFLKAICRWSNSAQGAAVVFQTRRVGSTKVPATVELHVNVGDRTFAISGEGSLPSSESSTTAPRYPCQKRLASESWLLLNKKRADAPRLLSTENDAALFPMQFDPSCSLNNIWEISAEVSRVAGSMIATLMQQSQAARGPRLQKVTTDKPPRRKGAAQRDGAAVVNDAMTTAALTTPTPQVAATTATPETTAAPPETTPTPTTPPHATPTTTTAPSQSSKPHTTSTVDAVEATPSRNNDARSPPTNPFDPFIIHGPLSVRARVLNDIRHATGCRVRWSGVPGDDQSKEVAVRIVGCDEPEKGLEAKQAFLKHLNQVGSNA